MNENDVKTNSARAWMLAARPKTLTGAAVPVMIGVAMAAQAYGPAVRWVPAILCLLFAFVMQIDANFVNDYFDFMRGNDDSATRLGPRRACTMGWVTASAMRLAIAITTVAGCVIGLPLIWYGGWEMIMVGLLCVVFCFLYTTTLSYLGLGDVLVLVFFGIVPVCFSYYLASPYWGGPWIQVLTLSLACGLVIDNLLIVNNFRDIDNDRRDGKITLIVRIGHRWALRLYLLLGIVAYLLVCSVGIADYLLGDRFRPLLILLPLIYVILHIATWRRMKQIGKGRELNKVLGATARNIFFFGLLVVLGLLM